MPFDAEFWGDRLEVGTELIRKQLDDDRYMQQWVEQLSPRCRSVLRDVLGIEDGQKLSDTRQAILSRRRDLLPFLLVEAAAAGKRTYAILEVARSKLKPHDIERCRIQSSDDDKFDRGALMWLLYLNSRENLELVFHFDQSQRRGFARMVLQRRPKTNGVDASTFFRKANLQTLLDEYERQERTLRQSYCAEILHHGGNYQVFIKRDYQESFISHGPKNTFGFEREWIILDFEPDLKRVHICSISPDVPLRLANRLASRFFEREVSYENDSLETDANQVAQFLASLIDNPEELPLVELTARNSGLHGSPQLRLSDPQSKSIASAVRQFAAAFSNPLDDPNDIESIKVYIFKKRVKLIFERVKGSDDLFIVRYVDQPLNGKERREFEQRMEQTYGIAVLSTEKRRA